MIRRLRFPVMIALIVSMIAVFAACGSDPAATPTSGSIATLDPNFKAAFHVLAQVLTYAP